MNPSSLKLRRTGKIALLFTLTLCAGQLYGMEPMEPQGRRIEFGEEWKTLPDEVKHLILMALMESGDNLDEAIKNIVKVSLINKKLNNNLNDLQRFTKVVHMLADKFGITTNDIAYKFSKFHIPTAEKYISLNASLLNYVGSDFISIDEIIKIINKGADVNFGSRMIPSKPLAAAIANSKIEVVKLFSTSDLSR
jgi:hypothetical protein